MWSFFKKNLTFAKNKRQLKMEIFQNNFQLSIFNFQFKIRPRSSMDRIKDSGSFDLGSNPSEVTIFGTKSLNQEPRTKNME